MTRRRQKPPKDHHFVPQFILRNFTDEKGRLHAFDRRTPQRGIFFAPPAKLFFESHLYTGIEPNGSKNVDLELGFARLEGAASMLISAIIGAARNDRLWPLSRDDRDLLGTFTYFQWKRVPDSFERIMTPASLRELGEQALAEFETEKRPLNSEEVELFSKPETWKRLLRNARRDAIGQASPAIVEVLMNMNLFVVHVVNSRKSFIVGSHPVVKLAYPGRRELGETDAELWMPVASDVALVFAGTGRDYQLRQVGDAGWVRHANMAVAAVSKLIASRSPLLTASLSKAAGDFGQ